MIRHGTPFVELVPAKKAERASFDRLDEIRQELGIRTVENAWPEEFDDPALSRAVLGLDEWGCCSTHTLSRLDGHRADDADGA